MKRFYNNTIMSGAFSKALRVVALLCVLLGVSSSAWGETYYLWYGSNDDYNNNSYQWSDGVSFSNNKGTFTINTSYWQCYVYIAKGSKSKSNLLTTPEFANPTTSTSVSNLYQGHRDGYKRIQFSTGTEASKSFTIECDFSNSSEYTFTVNIGSSSGGGAAACTPSATITGASYDGTNINLSGRLSQVCDGNKTFYGWQYKTSANGDWEAYISGTGGNDNSSQTTKDYSYAWNNGGNLVAGTTYYFRAYATYDAKTWYSDDKILSVTIPKGGGSTGEADCSGVVYLDPTAQLNGGKWTDASAWFAVYYWKGSGGSGNDGWVKMNAAASCTGLYYAVIPEGYSKLSFVRMNPASDALNWDSKLNQTGDLTLQQDKNCYNNSGWDGSDNTKWITTTCTDGCTPAEQPSTNVLLSREAIVNKSAKTAQLFGYLKSIKAPDCPSSAITDYGFFYCMVNDGDTPCLPLPTSSSTKLQVSPSDALLRGEEFTATVGLIKEPSDALQDGKTYYYRAYAKIDDKYILSGEIRSFSTDPCIPQYGGLSDKYVDGTPIVYTINADPAFAANDCKLHFKSLQDAIDHLKKTKDRDNDYKYVDGSYNLLQPVEMRVVYYDDTPDDDEKAYAYRGTTAYGMTAGNVTPTNVNLIEDINKTASNSANTLTIKAGTSKAKPWIHHIVIRNSKNIVLDSLCIYSDISGKGDNALEIDVNSKDWARLDIDPTVSSVAPMLDANITIQNSMIGSVGFTGVHVSGYGGITFKNNDFECTYPGTENDALRWGASAKFLACKDVKFIQNNFRGSQTSLLWIQESQNMLFMNNVFWNTNTNSTDKDQPIAAIRLVHQFDSDTNDYKKKSKVKNISFFYNTFYLADDKKESSHNYNFYCLSNSYDAHSSKNEFDLGSLYFKYNNCYSYDENLAGRSDNSGAFLGIDLSEHANFCPNNFWSEYDVQNPPIDGKPSAFAFGCSGNTFTNVKTQVCETTASGPASLIVKGQVMNTGKKLTDSDISSTGIELTANELTSDRYLIGVRPKDDTWTIGAYQSKDNIDTKLIYWVGVTDDWDDRNNWEYETEVDGKMVRQRVSCVNTLSEDLKVVIEEIGTVEIAGGRKWPQVPASFTENRTNSLYDEHVSAGLGTGKTPTKFASTIELEYGAGLRGVENLNDNGTMRYDQAIVHFDAERNKWLLVGPIVRPFDTEKNDGTTRNVNSGDYFRNFEPQIYMHGTVVDGENISWGKTFGDLNVDVKPDTVFAINASVLYGKYYDTAEDYLKYEGIKVDDKAPIPYRFTGRFAVEEYKTGDAYKYTLKDGAGKRHLINNVYPCNLDAKEIERLGLGTINVYNYNEASFASTSASQASGNVYIKAQNGFVFTPNEGKQLNLTNDILAEGSTRTRAGEIPLPTFSLNVDNANTTKPGASNIVVRYDEFLGTSEESLLNTPKVFTRNSDTPEAYIIHNDGKYTRLDAGKEKVTIPLGVRLMKPMNLTFEKVYNEGYDEVVLVDTKTQKFYNLLKRTYTTDVLSTGDTEGRFYLNLTVSGDDDLDDEGDNPGGDDIVDDDDVSTEVEETIEEPQINIYTVDNSIVRVSSVGTVLKTIYVSDMTGRTDEYSVDGNYVELQLPVSSGVYTVTAVGETASKIGKVILK